MNTRRTPTHEQLPIIRSKLNTLLVQAFSGAGKTATLEEFALANQGLKILLLTFSKALQVEAQQRFRGLGLTNVDCLTSHALAYARFGRAYQAAGAIGFVSPSDLMDFLSIGAALARAVLTTVENFIRSADAKITADHLPSDLAAAHRTEVGTYAQKAWESMKDLDGALKMPHDGYLKLFQLSQPDLAAQYDLIMVDEWQDTNAVTMDIVLEQDCRLILVGDRHQSIYGFRGATNAMDLVEADATMYLTQSFRFGQGIADLATTILASLKGETQALVGSGKFKSEFVVDRNQPYAVIARTNGTLFREAVSLLGRVKFTLVGGGEKLENYPFDRLIDVHYLQTAQNNLVRDAFLRRFADVDALRDYAEKVDDKELLSQLAIAKEFGRQIPDLVARIKVEACQKNPADAHVSLMTAHRSKGLQFTQVILSNDFEEFISEDGRLRRASTPELAQEANLLYVALTRAIRALETNRQIKEILAKLNQMGFKAPTSAAATVNAVTAAVVAAQATTPKVERSETAPTPARKAQPPVQLAQTLPVAPRELTKRAILEQVQHAILEAGLLDLGEMAAYLGRSKTEMARILGNLIANGRINARLFQHEPLVLDASRAAKEPVEASTPMAAVNEAAFL